MGLCSPPDIPAAPNPSAATVAGMEAETELYPLKRRIETAIRLGEKAYDENGNVIADFTDTGEVDYQKKYSREMAKAILALNDKYGADFVEQRMKELELADPEGTAARRRQYQKIMASLAETPDTSIAQATERAVMEDLNRGATLDARDARAVQQRELARTTRGGVYLGAAPARREAGVMDAAGQAKLAERQQRALAFLSSGGTAEDIEFRDRQQKLANLSSFLSGTTPQAQFSQLSGAQNQAVPFTGMGPMGGTVDRTGDAQAFNARLYTTQVNWAQEQVNPYAAGLGLGMQTAGMVAASRPSWNWGGGAKPTSAMVGTGQSYANMA